MIFSQLFTGSYHELLHDKGQAKTSDISLLIFISVLFLYFSQIESEWGSVVTFHLILLFESLFCGIIVVWYYLPFNCLTARFCCDYLFASHSNLSIHSCHFIYLFICSSIYLPTHWFIHLFIYSSFVHSNQFVLLILMHQILN